MIRTAKEEDAEKLLEIYSYYVEKTAVSFECAVPSADEFKDRIRRTLEKYPYLVSEQNGIITGYAYAGSFHTRIAYSRSAETSVYVAKNCRRNGIGKELYSALEKALARQNITNLYACIGYSEAQDEYLTHDSVKFHEHMGYKNIGEFSKCGCKFGRWYNIVWMEKHILPHTDNPSEFIPFKDISGNLFE